MNINLARMKKWDWGVIVAFVVTIIGVSIPWWKEKLTDILGDALGGLGDVVEGLAGAAAPSVSSFNVLGWRLDSGRAAFVFALIAALWVFAKVLLPADKPLPKWYMEAWPVMVIGGVLTLIGIIGTADAPFGGYDVWAWRPGGIITLIAGVGVLLCGYMMFKDKSGDYGESPMPNITTSGGSSAPPSGGAPPAGNPPAAQ